MKKNFLILLSLFFILFSNLSFAEEPALFGPKVLTVGAWHLHASSHTFSADSRCEGTMTVTSNGIREGLILVNGSLVHIGNKPTLSKTVSLELKNRITILLIAPPGSAAIVAVRTKVAHPPVATFVSEPSTIPAGEDALLTWTTTDAESVSIDQGIGTVSLNGSVAVAPVETTTYALTATGAGGTTTQSVTVTVNQPPTVGITANPETIQPGESTTLTWSSVNAETCIIEPGVGSVAANGSITAIPDETTLYTITATGPGGTATASVSVTVHDPSAPPTADIGTSPAVIAKGGSSTLSWTSDRAQSGHIDNGLGTVATGGSISISPEHTTTYTFTVTGETGSASSTTTVMVTGNPEPQPEGSFGEQYQDLIPPDATVDEYDSRRFAVITGFVTTLDNQPLVNVTVTIHDHPEYGTGSTGENGSFSIPVEGGGTITLLYRKEGMIPAQRQVYVPWNDIAIVETARMIAEDTASTTLTFDGSSETVVTHRSTTVTDEFGSRSCSMIFTGDNTAYLLDEDGNDVRELTTITVRATEFTTPESMPAILPPNSAYTYCAELTVDGAPRVRFEKPVIIWIDNFLGFDVGETVPVGYYDRDRGVWVPSNNGIVVKLLDTDGDGIVDALDADGDNLPDDLDNNGSFSNEVNGLDDPERYPPGATFWRVAVTHFTSFDFNWPFGPPEDAVFPNPEGEPDANHQKNQDCLHPGSVVEARSRIIHEDIPIPGTGMTLHYASKRVAGGYKTVITVPASGITVPESLKSIIVKVEVAGRTFEQILPPLPDQMATCKWDGLDHLGKQISSDVTAHVNIGFSYYGFFWIVGDVSGNAFARAGAEPTGISTRQEVILWKKKREIVIPPPLSTIAIIAEGWTLSGHHSGNSILYKGDGTIIRNNVLIIDTVAGNGESGYSGDGGPATEATLYQPEGVAVDAAGNLYIADCHNHCIRKVDTTGIITTVAGTGEEGYSGDGGLANDARLAYPEDIALDSSGNLYIADRGNLRVRRMDTNGIITTVAGTGERGYGGDGGLATEARLNSPSGVAVDPSGNLYLADSNNDRVRKVGTNGIITTVAGTGVREYSGDGGLATDARIAYPTSVAVDPAGNLYIADFMNNRVRKVGTNGIITTVAGTGVREYSGDGGPATDARLAYPGDVALDSSGNLYIADSGNLRVRRMDTNGIITTVAGTGEAGYSGDGGPATEAALGWPQNVAVDSSGNLYLVMSNHPRIRKVGLPSVFTGVMTGGDISFADESGFGYIMSSAGRHKQTIDLDTGTVLYEFEYDEDNNLISITDQFNNQTTINRDADGTPLCITSPDGLVTTLTIDTNNHLTGITYPDGGDYTFEYTSDGLMTTKTEPEGNRFDHVFDKGGRLTDATDEEGSHWHYERTALANGDILTKVTTGESNITSYLDHTYSTGRYTSTITDATGSETLFTLSADGLSVDKSLPCGMTLEFGYDIDPEYGVKYVKEMSQSTPSSLEKLTERNKTYEDTDSDDFPDLITDTISVNGKATIFENDVLQSQKTITSPEGRTATMNYNPDNLLTTSISVPGLFDTIYGYDDRGKPTSVTTNTRSTALDYDSRGFLSSVTDPGNHTTFYSHDSLGRVTGISRPDGSTLEFVYDMNGNMRILTVPSGVDHMFGYSAINLNNLYQTPISGSYSYLYDKDKRLKQIDFPSGKQITNIYDKTTLTQIQTPEGTIDLTYLSATQAGSITNGTNTITYGYDGKLVTSETITGTLNDTLSYTHNNDFNPSSFTYAGGTAGYTYDNDGLLTGAGRFTITRNAGNGLPESVTGGTLALNRSFNGYGETSGENIAIGGNHLASWNLTRDDNGRITSRTETTGGITSNYIYTYDSMGRLLTVTKDGVPVEEYRYNLNGTRIYEMNSLRDIADRSFTYSDEEHLLTAGTASYQYTVDGFLTTKTDGTEETYYEYSSRGELLGVTLPDGTEIEYMHDPLGRRIAKEINETITEKYLWQGLTRLLAVYDKDNNLTMRFEYADSRMPYAMTKGGSTYYLAYDQVGSLRIVADSAGTVVKAIDYDSFGNIINDTNPAFDIPLGFAGGLHDKNTGLVRFGYRDYDPDTGRWTAKDPILFAGGDSDLYGYCLNDPVNLVDPLGLEYWSRVWRNFQTTNGSVPGLLGPTGTGIVTAEHTAQVLGTTTLRTWLSSGLSGATLSGTSFTSLETGVLVGGTGVMNFAFTGIAWETGVGIGSLVSAIPVYGADQSITDWWANFWWDLLNDEKPAPCK